MKGDKVVFLNNKQQLGVQNGLTGEINRIDQHGNMSGTLDNKKDMAFNLRTYNHLDHGYAVTDYKSQGQTSKEVIFNADTDKNNSYNSFYEAITRGKEKVYVYTNDKDKLKEQVKKEIEKTGSFSLQVGNPILL